jgi:nucleoside-diphosphate-sugar epimerase
MKCLVTGSAGFIGSNLCDELLRRGHDVVGIDAFVPYYPTEIKRRNHAKALSSPGYHFYQLNLSHDSVSHLVEDKEIIFHLAAMPGLTQSWTDFESYLSCNVRATQQLLEAVCRSAGSLRCFVFGSTSSVYGRYSSGDETLPTKPISPYGVTKLAAENLCRAYSEAYDIPLTVLRYFSVYGPRQRPDMGYYRFIQAFLHGQPVVVYGDGNQARGNTYVTDCVAATIAASQVPPGEVYNIGGYESVSVWDVLRMLGRITGVSVKVRQEPARPGDQRQTFADTRKFTCHTGWKPLVGLEEGLVSQFEWQKQDPGPLGSHLG